MSLLLRVNLILGAVCLIASLTIIFLSRGLLRENANREVMAQAHLMMEAARSARDYTGNHVEPLLATMMKSKFMPEVVPFFASTQLFEQLRKAYPEYSYKEATLNPTNPSNRAIDWELEIIRHFRDFPADAEWAVEHDGPFGPMLALARPIRVDSNACLVCHSTPGVAPATFREKYGDQHGYGWQLGEIIGSQIVTVPATVPLEAADRMWRGLIVVVIGAFVVIFVAVDAALILLVCRPVAQMSLIADDLSRGARGVEEFEPRGAAEIVALGASFNRMRRSLEKAMKLLNA
jgi:protein-histidine pros-kinase